jgi:hypothetical protein
MNWFLEKMRLYSEVLSGIDDPRGGHLRNLEAQVRRLESEIARLEVLVEALRHRGWNGDRCCRIEIADLGKDRSWHAPVVCLGAA